MSNPSKEQFMRRKYLITLGTSVSAIGLAGCAGDRNDSESSEGENQTTTDTDSPDDTTSSTEDSSVAHEFKSPPYENVETEENGSTTTFAGEIVLEPGEYAQQEFELEETTQLQITGGNEGEGTLDLFLLSPESELSTYMDGESADFNGGFTETDFETVDRSVEISSGSYFFVFDNTAVYGAEPQGTVRFEFQFVLERGIPSEEETPEGENNAEIVSESDMPKIRKVTDNFGHTFVRDPDEDDDGFSVQVEDEVVVSDDTSIRLTVEEILANPEDEISYSYDSSIRDHPDNMRSDDRTRSNTHTWDMRREDYSSDWGFRAYLRNEDDIYYQNESAQTDFLFRVTYSNLTLE